MKISSFCLITDPDSFGYPYLESIKSFADISDEVLVIDGGTPDDTLKQIKKISPKVKIIQRDDLKWEQNWSYERMGYNVNEGYKLCSGNVVINFGIDWIIHEKDYDLLKRDIHKMIEQNKLVLTFCRLNFTLLTKYFEKSHKILAINKDACKKRSVMVQYGFDKTRWGHGFEPIAISEFRDRVWHGTLLNSIGNAFPTKARIFNYSFSFSTKDQVKDVRQKHQNAVNMYFGEPKGHSALGQHIKNSIDYFIHKKQIPIKLEEHPKIIQNKIKNLSPDKKGYNMWNLLSEEKYYDQT